MSETKSPPGAFMPSPNDSLQSLRSSAMTSPPSSIMPNISHREQIPSASRVPSTSRERLTSPIRVSSIAQDPDEELSWQELYHKQQEAFELKDDISRRERKKLQAELVRLQSELMMERSKSKQLELALETARMTRNGTRSRDTSRDRTSISSFNGEDGVRKLSDSLALAAPAALQAPLPKMNGNSRLSSISEVAGENSPKTLQWIDQQARGGIFGHAPHITFGGDGNSDVSPGADRTPRADEPQGPRSPPSSRAILSPPPPKNRAYAGHTPLKPEALSVSSTPGGVDTPTVRNTHRNAEAPVPSASDPVHDVPEDRALTGPLALPEYPGNGGDVFISALDEKLQDAVQFPGYSRPTVLQGTVSEDGDGSEVPTEDHPASMETEAEVEAEADSAALDAGPKLKVKRSMNFGAPIGALPSKSFMAE